MSLSPLLPVPLALEVAQLAREIAVLREARECVTHAATPGVIYGRVDDLINVRQDRLLGLYRQARIEFPANEAIHHA